MSAPLSSYTTPDAIRDRLAVLRDKRGRINAYNNSCKNGSPDATLLDEKQAAKLAFRNEARARREFPPLTRFPWTIWRTLGWTIHILETRLHELHTSGSAATESETS